MVFSCVPPQIQQASLAVLSLLKRPPTLGSVHRPSSSESQSTVRVPLGVLTCTDHGELTQAVGTWDGESLGIKDGASLGKDEGKLLGLIEGKLLGTSEGISEGKSLGSDDGNDDDKLDGTLEGTDDGRDEGADDGIKEGRLDGAEDGTFEGFEDSWREGFEEIVGEALGSDPQVLQVTGQYNFEGYLEHLLLLLKVTQSQSTHLSFNS